MGWPVAEPVAADAIRSAAPPASEAKPANSADSAVSADSDRPDVKPPEPDKK
jgi:hypothetical protein